MSTVPCDGSHAVSESNDRSIIFLRGRDNRFGIRLCRVPAGSGERPESCCALPSATSLFRASGARTHASVIAVTISQSLSLQRHRVLQKAPPSKPARSSARFAGSSTSSVRAARHKNKRRPIWDASKPYASLHSKRRRRAPASLRPAPPAKAPTPASSLPAPAARFRSSKSPPAFQSQDLCSDE